MSIHSDCGREIRWANRNDDPERFHPPLEFSGQAYIITEDNIAVFVNTYKQHECDPDEIKLWLELKRRQAEAKGISTDYIDAREERIIARERDRAELNSRAMSTSCPTCKASVSEMCFNLHSLKRGEKVYNKNPHPDRLEKAARES